MKTSQLGNKKGVFRSIITTYTCMFLTVIMLSFTGCSSDNDDDKTVYTVAFETNGGTPVPSVQKVEEGGTATTPSTNPAKVDYAFVFWHLSEATNAYNFQTPVNRDITLQAKWQEEAAAEYWQVSWNLNGGAWPSDDNHATQVIKGGTLAEPNIPTKAGSTFDGWYKESTLNNKINFPYDVSGITGNFTLYARWTNGGGEDSGTFTSISALKSWLASQPDNTSETPYEIGLKGVNLDAGNNWTDLGVAIGQIKYVDLDLQGCTGTAIPDGRFELTWEGNTPIGNYYGAFVGSRFTTIKLPESVKIIGKYAFYNCRRLIHLSLPNGLTEIRQGAFGSNQSGITGALKSVSLPAELKIIGDYAFGRTGLTEVIMLPVAPPAIGEYIFLSTSSSLKIKVPEGSVTAYKTASGWKDYADKIIANTN